jgi:hypothetical protein
MPGLKSEDTPWYEDHIDKLVERAVKAEQQRDELLRAARDVCRSSSQIDGPIADLRAAITKIEEGK